MGHGIGIKRNDYHRRNRRENISMHNTSAGRNVGGTEPISVPIFSREDLIRNASDWAGPRNASLESVCVGFLLKRIASVSLLRALEAIGHAYSWLAAECDCRYKEHRRKVRVVKRHSEGNLSKLQFQEANEPKSEPVLDNEDYGVSLDGALCSLASERLIFFPPFLRPAEIRERRFGNNMNDNWWQWEAEMDFVSWRGRLNDKRRISDYEAA